MGAHEGDDKPHLPPPSLWPAGFAVGIACLLLGVIVGWPVVALGAFISLVFGFLWVRDLTAGERAAPVEVEPERREALPAPPIQAHVGEAARPEPEPGEVERFPRSRFLENTTLGLGALIGGLVSAPAIGFAVVPVFLKQGSPDVDLGGLDAYPEGQFVVATFLLDPKAGEVSRRTAFVRNNGLLQGKPSFTVLSNRCVHLGCPIQPNGPVFDKQTKTFATAKGEEVRLIPSQPAGFGCPCHGGQYDTEGNRTAGPPVRALDRYQFSIRNGRLFLGGTYSVGHVDGEGANAKIRKYNLHGPGQHVDGPEWWFYPVEPPH